MRSFRSAVIAVCVLSSLVTGCAGEADSGEGSVPQSGPQVTTEDAPWSEAPTQKGTYLVAWKPAGGTVPLNEYCSILMRVNRADGSPIEGQVELFFRADMPAHGHGMNVVPVVKPVADGLYQAEGVLLHMRGDWKVGIDVIVDGTAESASFDLTLE